MSVMSDKDSPSDASVGSASESGSVRSRKPVTKNPPTTGDEPIVLSYQRRSGFAERTMGFEQSIKPVSELTSDGVPRSVEYGWSDGDSTAGGSTSSTGPRTSTPPKNSGSSEEPSGRSKPKWKRQTTAKGLAAQMEAVGAGLLNEEIPLETARVYAALARATVQAMGIEVTKARFSKQIPDLDLADEELFDGGI
jgi:hypothetical protein